VHIVGEPGIGKSRLLEEFRRSQRDTPMMYIESQCLSYGTTSPYLPVRQILQQMCGITEADSPETITCKVSQRLQDVRMPIETSSPLLLSLLGHATSVPPIPILSPQQLKEQTFAVLLQFCMHISLGRPLVLEVENLHWIDATSEEWLAALIERIAARSMLILGTFRPGYHPTWLGSSHVSQISLTRLSPRESLRVLQATSQGNPLSEPLVHELLTKADGNPFFLEELTRAIMEQGPEHTLAIPATVQAVLAARIDRLPPHAKRLLQVAAIIGKEAELPLLAGVTDLPSGALNQRLQQLQKADFLYATRLLPTPVYTFKHALTQEVAYQSLLLSTRRPYHQRIAEVLCERFPETVATHSERLAQHYTQAGCGEQAVDAWQQAGERARTHSSYVEAQAHFEQGLQVLMALPDTPARRQRELALLMALGPVMYMLKDRGSQDVEHLYRRARHLCRPEETPALFSVLYGLWRYHGNRGEQQIARELGQELLYMAQHAHDIGLELMSHCAMGATLFRVGELPASLKHLEQGIALYDPLQHRSLTQHYGIDPGVGCLCFATHVSWLLGYPDRALKTIEQALSTAQQPLHAPSLSTAFHFAAVLHQFRHEPQATLAYADMASAHARAHQFPSWETQAMLLRGWACAVLGDPQTGMRHIQDGLVAYQMPMAKPYPLSLLAAVCAMQGWTKEGRRVVAEAVDLIQQGGVSWWKAELLRLQGLCGLRQPAPDPSQAEQSFSQALHLARRQQAKALELRVAIQLSRLWHSQGKRLAARQLLGPIYSWFTEGVDTADLLEARDLLSDLG
jgi:predicted ATPase